MVEFNFDYFNIEEIGPISIQTCQVKDRMFRFSGKRLISNKEYIVRLCVRNVFGQQNCIEKEIRTIDNHNSTMLVKILGDQHRKLKGMRRYHLKRK